jgi:hypothetical protein
MDEPNPPSARGAIAFLREPVTLRWLASAGVLAIGVVVGGYLLGNGLVRAREADRSVTVRGLAERNVTADLAIWTLSYSSTAPSSQGSAFRPPNCNRRPSLSPSSPTTASPSSPCASACPCAAPT